jgi:hypothetical protein
MAQIKHENNKGWKKRFMAKRICAALLLLALLLNQLVCISAVADGNTSASTAAFVLSNTEAAPGDTVSISVTVRNNPGIISLRLKIYYDDSVMNLEASVKPDDCEFTETTFGPLSGNPFSLLWDDSLSSENNTANGIVATLIFKVADDAAPGTYPITLSYDEDDVFDIEFENVYFESVAGSLTVLAAETEAETEPETEHEHTPAEAVHENEVEADCSREGSYDEVVYCSSCGEEMSRVTVEVPATEHEDSDSDHTCDHCGKVMTACSDENGDGKCDICGKMLSKSADDAVSVFAIDDIRETDMLKWHAAAIVIGDTVSMRVKFSLTDEEITDKAVIRVEFTDETVYAFGKADLVLGEDGFFYIEIADIPASRYDTEFTAALYEEKEVLSDVLHYSVASYVYAMKDHARTGSYVREMYEDAQS